MKIFRLLVLALMIAILGMVVSAQTTTPTSTESPEDNACFAGGLLEGKCDWPTDAENEWAWTCGWYIARYGTGEFTISQVPEWCNYFVGVDPIEDATCYYSLLSLLPNFTLNNALNTLDNATFYENDGPACVTLTGEFGTVVEGADASDAQTVCESIFGTPDVDVSHLQDDYQFANVPDTWYACYLLLYA